MIAFLVQKSYINTNKKGLTYSFKLLAEILPWLKILMKYLFRLLYQITYWLQILMKYWSKSLV